MDGTKLVTKDASGNITFTSEKTYIKTDSNSAIKLALCKPSTCVTNPIARDGSTLSYVSGPVMGFVGAMLDLVNPYNDCPTGTDNILLPAFPVAGSWRFKWMRRGINDDAHESYGSFSVQETYVPWLIKRYPSDTSIGTIYAAYGALDTSSGKSSSSTPMMVGTGVWNYPFTGAQSDLTISVAAFEYLKLVAFYKLSDKFHNVYTGKQYGWQLQPYSWGDTSALNYPRMMAIWTSADTDLPLAFTV